MTDKHIAKSKITINAPAKAVWEALTNPELIKEYLFGTEVTTDWKAGSPITYNGEWQGKPYFDKGEIVEIVPEKLLVSTYFSSLSELADIAENYKTVTYELSEHGDSTKVTITQDNNNTEAEAKHSEDNWKMVLEGLKRVVEK